jgi:endogenous inhibitor of DNA gyrase (YacG/DUF329 family)
MSTRITGAMVRGVPISRGQQIQRWGKDRICAAEDCTTVLSMYNASCYCSVHAPARQASLRRRAERPLREVECEYCGAPFTTTNPVRRYCSDRCRMAAFSWRQKVAAAAKSDSGERSQPPLTSNVTPLRIHSSEKKAA